MSDLISGKEALIALANGEEVQARHTQTGMGWNNAKTLNLFSFESSIFEFRLKPKKISLNGIEIPAPFEPKHGDDVWYISNALDCCYSRLVFNTGDDFGIGFWKSEEEIKQVVAALRSIFNVK